MKNTAMQREEALQGAQWLNALPSSLDEVSRQQIVKADELALLRLGETRHWTGQRLVDHARATAVIVGNLALDKQAIAASLLVDAKLDDAPVKGAVAQAALPRTIDPGTIALAKNVAGLAPIQLLGAQAAAGRKTSERAAQLEAIRKMLLAMVEDIRAVLIKLADQLQTLRYLAAHGDSDARQNAARDTLDLLAPLANRLGVWQLKWELEDLAFRCADPVTYKNIARDLDEKRTDRESYLAVVMSALEAALREAGIKGDISGRPKHIYSIWKKMQRKGLRFEQLSDVRAVRVLVEKVSDCYAVLGLVHQLWTPVPGEFDDYIAKPKANDYRSLHTAVVGPEGKIIEVQIRTRDMHEHAELGVAAHWRYKESSRSDAAYDRKIAWLRQILDWRDDVADGARLAESFRGELQDDTVYVLTPQGRVVDLPAGATPVDFAYHVHTELGHRCRGAKVNGRLVPLNQPLANGQVVEIVAANEGGPSRDWLNPELGYLASNRGRAKVRQWFNSQAREEALASGRAELENALHRLGQGWRKPDELAALLHFASTDDLFLAFHRGDINQREFRVAIEGEREAEAEQPLLRPAQASGPSNAVLVVGVDRLLTTLARCCKPVPHDPIVGFVSKGRGVMVHRTNCRNVASLPQERLIEAQWAGLKGNQRFETDIEVLTGGTNLPIREILDVFSGEKMRVTGTTTYKGTRQSRVVVSVEIDSLEHLDRLLTLLESVDGVAVARRR